MSKKGGKSMVFDSAPDAKARLKHQSLMQDYVELQKEVDTLRGTLDEAKQRKLVLAAEVRFLRRRYKQLVETKKSSAVNEHLLHLPVLTKATKKGKEKQVIRNGLPPVPEPKPRKKQCTNKQVVVPDSLPTTARSRKKIIHGERNEPVQGRMHIKKEASTLILGNSMFSLNEMSSRASVPAFDLNLDSRPSGEGTSLPRAPIFDLNQVSTGDEDFVEATKFEEAMNDLKLSICRNAGEGSSRVGKRKISWQDPVALSV